MYLLLYILHNNYLSSFTQGETCKNCEAVTHIHCLKAYVKNRNSMACPNCHHSESGQVQPGNFFIALYFNLVI